MFSFCSHRRSRDSGRRIRWVGAFGAFRRRQSRSCMHSKPAVDTTTADSWTWRPLRGRAAEPFRYPAGIAVALPSVRGARNRRSFEPPANSAVRQPFNLPQVGQKPVRCLSRVAKERRIQLRRLVLSSRYGDGSISMTVGNGANSDQLRAIKVYRGPGADHCRSWFGQNIDAC